MNFRSAFFSFIIVSIFFFACGKNQVKENRETHEDNPDTFVPQTSEEFLNILDAPMRDSLVLDVIIYTYKLPPYASKETRFNPEFRQFYINQLPKFTVVDFKREYNTFYMLLLRPARNVNNHKRTVAVRFDVDDQMKISNFEEIFNTPMLSDRDAVERGIKVFRYYLENKDLGDYFGNTEYVEFPDSRTRYNKETLEWYYPRELEEQFKP